MGRSPQLLANSTRLSRLKASGFLEVEIRSILLHFQALMLRLSRKLNLRLLCDWLLLMVLSAEWSRFCRCLVQLLLSTTCGRTPAKELSRMLFQTPDSTVLGSPSLVHRFVEAAKKSLESRWRAMLCFRLIPKPIRWLRLLLTMHPLLKTAMLC